MNLVVPAASVTVAPTAPEKLTSRKGDSGGDLVYHLCGNVRYRIVALAPH